MTTHDEKIASSLEPARIVEPPTEPGWYRARWVRAMGFRPDGICEPAVIVLVQRVLAPGGPTT